MKHATSMKTPTTILHLPAEVRNMIYGYMTPVNGFTADYAGMFLCCKQIRREMEGGAIAALSCLMNDVEKNWNSESSWPLQIPRPTSFPELQHLTIKLPRSMYTGLRQIGSQAYFQSSRIVYPETLQPIFHLRLTSLTLDIYDDEMAGSLPPYGAFDALLGPGFTSRILPYPMLHCFRNLLRTQAELGPRKLVIGFGDRVTEAGASMLVGLCVCRVSSRHPNVKEVDVLDEDLARVSYTMVE